VVAIYCGWVPSFVISERMYPKCLDGAQCLWKKPQHYGCILRVFININISGCFKAQLMAIIPTPPLAFSPQSASNCFCRPPILRQPIQRLTNKISTHSLHSVSLKLPVSLLFSCIAPLACSPLLSAFQRD